MVIHIRQKVNGKISDITMMQMCVDVVDIDFEKGH